MHGAELELVHLGLDQVRGQFQGCACHDLAEDLLVLRRAEAKMKLIAFGQNLYILAQFKFYAF